jgi:hypothetical protein
MPDGMGKEVRQIIIAVLVVLDPRPEINTSALKSGDAKTLRCFEHSAWLAIRRLVSLSWGQRLTYRNVERHSPMRVEETC